MSEENVTKAETTVTAAPSVQAPVVATKVTTPSSIQLKDMLIPLSIVIAGLAVGAGLYFNGGNLGGSQVAKGGAAEEKVVDTTDKINPISDADHIKGNPKAPVKIVEYSDFECPFCKRNHETLVALQAKYGDDKVAWVFRQFPLEQLHQKAKPVALASECVASLGGNDAFWKFADGYFDQTLTNDKTDIEVLIPKLVTATGVNKTEFTDCFENEKQMPAVEEDVADAVETGGRGTPWSIIVGPSGKTYPINGALPASAWEAAIEKALNEA